MSFCLIADRLSPPYDEGIKNIGLNMAREFSARPNMDVVLEYRCEVLPRATVLPLGRSFIAFELARWLRVRRPEAIFYLPATSLTPAALLRANVLRILSAGAKIVGIVVQNRSWSARMKRLGRLVAMDGVVVLSEEMRDEFGFLGQWSEVFTPGVDLGRFAPAGAETKRGLRARHGFGEQQLIVLHVGHLKASRNLEMASAAVAAVGGTFVVVSSGTTAAETEPDTLRRLHEAGARVVQGTRERIEDYFILADCYIFPVLRRTGATEMPLSVLEAMATNLPVITTPYGALPDVFAAREEAGFFYASGSDAFAECLAKSRACKNPGTRQMVAPLSWERVVNDLFARLASRVGEAVR